MTFNTVAFRDGRSCARRLVGSLILALAASAIVGCGSEETPPEDVAGGGSRPVLECEFEGYPCTWGEVSEEAARRTDQVGQIAAALMKTVGDPAEVAMVLAEEVELAELQVDELAVRFRLPDSRPAWVPTPYDPEHPRRGGGSSASQLALAPAFQTVGFLSRPLAAQGSGGRNNVTGTAPGAPKSALILAPFYYELGLEVAKVYESFVDTRDFKLENGGNVVLRANLHSSRENDPVRVREDAVKPVSGQVTIQDFIGWDAYNFVYLATHGYAVCPNDENRAPQIAAGKCHTSISVRDLPGGAEGLRQARADRPQLGGLWNLPGVDPSYKTVGTVHPGLSPNEARACLQETDSNAMAPGTTKPCFVAEQIPTEVSVSTEFFRKQYPGGFNDIVIFFAVCEAFKANDLEEALAPEGNHDVAIFGFEEAVDSYVARVLGTKAVDMFVKGFPSTRVKTELEKEARKLNVGFFEGVVRGEDDQGVGPAIGSITESSTNRTHARDVVELIDPETGEELDSGGRVKVRGCPGDGEDDLLVIHPAVIGVHDAGELGAIELGVSIGSGDPAEWYQPKTRLDEGKYASLEHVAMGRDAQPGEQVVDLEIRGELPDEGRSLWRYEDVTLVADGPCPCTFTATVSGDSNRGSVEGEWAVFSTRGQASMLGASVDQGAVMEDLVGAMKMMQGLQGLTGDGGDERTAQLLEGLEKKAEESRQASPGGTIGINLVESGPGIAGGFKIDALARGSIEPGFTGSLEISRASVHTGEFASEGGAPMMYLLDKESKDHQGSVTLTVHEYDGEFLEGTISGDMIGLAMIGSRRARLSFSADFSAGLFNPLRMENVCLMAKAFADSD